MIGIRTRRSLVFQLWMRLSAITVAFTLLALGIYVWLEIGDSVENANAQSVESADAIAAAVVRVTLTGQAPTNEEVSIARSLGVESIQILNSDGSVAATFENFDGPTSFEPARMSGDRIVIERGYEARFTGDSYRRMEIGALDLLRGGEYGAVFVYVTPAGTEPGALRIVIGYDDIAGAAQTLLFRSLALTGAILIVVVMAQWVLLNRFVAEPLRQYSATARRIAAGESLRMPDMGSNELGQLGRAINGMADILRYEATMDTMTGLYNLRHLTSRLEPLVEEAREQSEPIALLVCDLDNLKPVNDTYGHHAGDVLLKTVAQLLLAWSEMDYTCWRTGGDEFVAVIPGAGPEAAVKAVAALQERVEATTIGVQGGEIAISLSVGFATYPVDGLTGAALMNVADLRMYESKARKVKPLPTPAA